MAVSNRGARGIPKANIPTMRAIYRSPNQDPPAAGGSWYTHASYATSGTFTYTAPSTNVALNKRGKVELYFTATAAGGTGGSGVPTGSGGDFHHANGGQAGQWCRRFKAEVWPGEVLTIAVPSATTAPSNGASLTVINSSGQTILSLSGGSKGADAFQNDNGGTQWGSFTGTSGAIVSGSEANENAIRQGARGGYGRGEVISGSTTIVSTGWGDSNMVFGALGGAPTSASSAGGGGAGLFGAPTGGVTNTGAGSVGYGGSWGGTGNGGTADGGRIDIEVRVAS